MATLRPYDQRRAAFTLIELMVTLVIVAILSSLTLAGLAGARLRAKIDKTRNTIRKLQEIITPQYESYVRRRLPAASPVSRLHQLRTLMCREMPDNWNDVFANVGSVPSGSPFNFQSNGRVLAYAQYRNSLATTLNSDYEGAECLYMIATLGADQPDAMEGFRADEIGDADSDGALEFHDAWGKPILFMRWAPGFSSPYSLVQTGNSNTDHDPMDPQRVDPTAFRLVPLIASGGPDQLTGLQVIATGWTAVSLQPLTSLTPPHVKTLSNDPVGFPERDAASSASPKPILNYYQDNITNHAM